MTLRTKKSSLRDVGVFSNWYISDIKVAPDEVDRV